MGWVRRVRTQVAGGVTALGAGLVIAFAFLPWVVSGEAERNSFQLVGAARSLGVLDDGVPRLAGIAWFLVPLAAAGCWLVLALGRRRSAALLGTLTGVAGVVMGLAVRSTPLSTRSAVDMTIGAGIVAISGAALITWRDKETT